MSTTKGEHIMTTNTTSENYEGAGEPDPLAELERLQQARTPRKLGPSKHDGLAITAFITAFIVPLIGVILGAVSISTAHRDGRRASGLAAAGVILGIIGCIVYIAVIVAVAKAHALPDATQQWLNCSQAQIQQTTLPAYCGPAWANGNVPPMP